MKRRRRWLLVLLLLLLLLGGVGYFLATLPGLEDGTPFSQAPLALLESPTYRLRHHERPRPPAVKPLPWRTREDGFRHWIFSAMVNLSFPMSGWNSNYAVGTGEDLEVGYALDRHWTMGLGMSFLNFSGSYFGIPLSNKATQVNLLARYFWGNGGIQPYLAAQAGGAWQVSTAIGTSVENFNPSGGFGGGVELGLDEATAFYGESLFNFIFLPKGAAWEVPISTGLRFKL